jgi:hypothetical protein
MIRIGGCITEWQSHVEHWLGFDGQYLGLIQMFDIYWFNIMGIT